MRPEDSLNMGLVVGLRRRLEMGPGEEFGHDSGPRE